MSNEALIEKLIANLPKRGPKKGVLKENPRDPEKVMKIIFLRDKMNLDWRTIGKLVGETHQGPYLLYKRWYEWAKEKKDDKHDAA